MSRRADRRYRMLLPTIMVAALVGCRVSAGDWRERLAQPAVARLEGSWTMEFRGDDAGSGAKDVGPRAAGTLALVINRAQVAPSWFGSAPVAFGTFDLALERLGVVTDDEPGAPTAAVTQRGDTLVLRLGTEATWPIVMTGRWSGDSLIGRWSVHHRSGSSPGGTFLLRRR